ncbi:MAG: hypothetical protein K0S29_623 [Gammaproteobacteria bacterium]|jgi:hypothetical protein|nr:hypothetical protein [Gammaproteobacteria bacterium]
MSHSIRYIVGDKFAGFANSNQEVITISNFERSLDYPLIGNHSEISFLIGQGVNIESLQKLLQKIEQKNLQEVIKIKNSHLLYLKESAKQVHKAKLKNIMITAPLKTSEACYESLLILDDECAEMDDHVTGQHIQGMVLVEAARQMMLAVTEHYYLNQEEQNKYYFVLNKIMTEFQQFAFPLDIKIKCRQIDFSKKNASSLSACLNFEFIQNEKLITTVNIDFSAYLGSKLANHEARLARNAIEVHSAGVEDSNLPSPTSKNKARKCAHF